jgi:large subunit ribosomal protein L30
MTTRRKAPAPRLRIVQVRSQIGNQTRVKRVLTDGLGLGRIGSSVVRPDNPYTRGMIAKVAHIVTFTELAAEPYVAPVEEPRPEAAASVPAAAVEEVAPAVAVAEAPEAVAAATSVSEEPAPRAARPPRPHREEKAVKAVKAEHKPKAAKAGAAHGKGETHKSKATAKPAAKPAGKAAAKRPARRGKE